jgi:hypothetical protein
MISFEFREEPVATRLSKGRSVSDRSGSEQRMDDWLNVALEDSFPCSDPISSMRVD